MDQVLTAARKLWGPDAWIARYAELPNSDRKALAYRHGRLAATFAKDPGDFVELAGLLHQMEPMVTTMQEIRDRGGSEKLLHEFFHAFRNVESEWRRLLIRSNQRIDLLNLEEMHSGSQEIFAGTQDNVALRADSLDELSKRLPHVRSINV